MEDICIVSELFVVGIIARFMFQKNGRNGPDLIREWKRDLEPRFLHANYYELWLKIWLISIKASAALISGQKKNPACGEEKEERKAVFLLLLQQRQQQPQQGDIFRHFANI